jgi:hypothetical protein
MIKQLNLTDPRDLKVVNGWIAESRIRMMRSVLLGSSAVILATGLGIAAVIWANRAGPDPQALAEAFKTALATLPPLPVTGSVAVADGAAVALKDGGEVTLKPGGTVALKDGAEVSLKPGSVPAMPQVPLTPQQKSESIRREVTVFTSVPFSDGDVTTGWEFASGDAKRPSRQFCYFLRPVPGKPDERINLVADGVRVPSANLMPNVDAAISKCVWWRE